MIAAIDVSCYQSVERHRNRRAIKRCQQEKTPAPKRLQRGHQGCEFQKELVYGGQPDILTDRVAALEACAADTMARGELKMSALQMPAQGPNPAQIFATIQGYQQSYVLKAAVDLGIFSAIARGNHTVPAIAKAIQASERGTRIMC